MLEIENRRECYYLPLLPLPFFCPQSLTATGLLSFTFHQLVEKESRCCSRGGKNEHASGSGFACTTADLALNVVKSVSIFIGDDRSHLSF
jgi:hypothetical protein